MDDADDRAPGRQEWSIRAIGDGRADVRFEYRQPWMRQGDPTWVFDLKVWVEEGR